ncbi:MAG: cytochrome P450 [Paracoccaceae bacterium]|nr:cytochrome P450 [Paracoccaceae bacterium]MDG1370380.1 cytochrome P450 [Paracoccaceae bacterium]
MTLTEGHLTIDPPAGVPVWNVDPYAPDIQTDPIPFFADLRAKGPFAYLPKYSMLICGGYEVTKEVFSDHERFVSSRGVGLQDFSMGEPWRPPSIVLEVDPPDHNRTRRAIMRALSPKVVADLKPLFKADADALVASLIGRDIDGVADLAEVFPCTVFPKAVGLKNPDRKMLLSYGLMVFNALGPDNAQRQAAMANAPVVGPWIAEQCLRENLTEGGIGAAIYASADDGVLTEDEAGMLVRSLLSAGVDTTVTAVGSALWSFAKAPEQFAVLRDDLQGRALAAFEETIRYTSPVNAFCRTTNVDTEVAGVSIAAGTKILCVLGAANLDDAHWLEADRFDISRRTIGHLGLGAGVHTCVGQNIARAEGQAVLQALGEQVSAMKQTGPAVWRANNAIRALDSLPLRLEA